MKNKLLPLFLVLGSLSAYSQVGIGTNNPDPSAQLQVTAPNGDRGVLIPNVKLQGTTIEAPIKSPAESLLVFNTETVSDVKPGYYYWSNKKWNRIALASEITGNGGTSSGAGAPGKEGEAGYPGKNVSIYTDTTTGTVYVQNPDGTWSSLNGLNGLDGKNGIAGGTGVPGAQIIREHF